MQTKNRIHGPLDTSAPPIMEIMGLQIAFVADCPEGGFLQIVSGDNPVGIPTPGVQIAKGQMLALIPAEAAAQIRPLLAQAEAQARAEYAKRMFPGNGH
jgi:hypothetical protein